MKWIKKDTDNLLDLDPADYEFIFTSKFGDVELERFCDVDWASVDYWMPADIKYPISPDKLINKLIYEFFHWLHNEY